MTLSGTHRDRLLKRFGWLDDDPSQDIEAMYLAWIYGVGLQNLSNKLGTSTSNLRRLLQEHYGKNATSLYHKSLLRSVAEDYPDSPTVALWIIQNIRLEEQPTGYVATQMQSMPIKPVYGGIHRSVKGLDNISKHESKTWVNKETLDRLGLQLNNGRKVNTSTDRGE